MSRVVWVIVAFVIIVFALGSCPMKVKDVTIKLEPPIQGGVFWRICTEYSHKGLDAAMYFEIHDKKGIVREYDIPWIHFEEECDSYNILNFFPREETPDNEYNWIRGLWIYNVDYIVVRVKEDWEDEEYIFEKTILSQDLKP